METDSLKTLKCRWHYIQLLKTENGFFCTWISEDQWSEADSALCLGLRFFFCDFPFGIYLKGFDSN